MYILYYIKLPIILTAINENYRKNNKIDKKDDLLGKKRIKKP